MSGDFVTLAVTVITTLIGTFGGILTAQKLSTYRIEQLEHKVDKHNQIIEKTYGLEKDFQDIRKDVDRIDVEHKKTNDKVQEIDKRVTVLEKERV